MRARSTPARRASDDPAVLVARRETTVATILSIGWLLSVVLLPWGTAAVLKVVMLVLSLAWAARGAYRWRRAARRFPRARR